MNTAPTTPERPERTARQYLPFNAGAFFANKDRLARYSLLVAALALLVAVLALMLTGSRFRQKFWFAVLDPAGTVILAPGLSFSDAKELHVQQAMLATTALLLRNPQDFEQPEILKALYSRQALGLATALKAAEAREFQERQIQQKPQILRLESIATRQDEIQMQVTGQLVRSGVIHQSAFQEVVPFTLQLVLANNSDLLRNRRQPTVVTRFHLAYEDARR